MLPESQTTDVLLSEWADDEEMLELVEMFVGALLERVAAIEQALEQEDLSTLASLSHQMKGSAGGYGFPTITDVAAQLDAGAESVHIATAAMLDPLVACKIRKEFA